MSFEMQLSQPSQFQLLRRLRFRHLVVAVAIGKHGSLNRAASVAGMTQPTATRAISDLEAFLQCTLFDRSPRGMRPTDLGYAFIAFAEEVIGGLSRFSEASKCKAFEFDQQRAL